LAKIAPNSVQQRSLLYTFYTVSYNPYTQTLDLQRIVFKEIVLQSQRNMQKQIRIYRFLSKNIIYNYYLGISKPDIPRHPPSEEQHNIGV
jgi:hypothetical protein